MGMNKIEQTSFTEVKNMYSDMVLTRFCEAGLHCLTKWHHHAMEHIMKETGKASFSNHTHSCGENIYKIGRKH